MSPTIAALTRALDEVVPGGVRIMVVVVPTLAPNHAAIGGNLTAEQMAHVRAVVTHAFETFEREELFHSEPRGHA